MNKIVPLQILILQRKGENCEQNYTISNFNTTKKYFADRNVGLVDKIVPLKIFISQRFLQTENRKILI